MSKKKAFVKYTKQGRLIPGSLIVTTNGGYPVDGLYTEVPTNICCDTDIPGTITTSPKGWVRYTKKGAIVPGSLVVGKSHPKDGVWKEVTISLCCEILIPTLGTWKMSNIDSESVNPPAGFITFPDVLSQITTLDPNAVGSGFIGLYINIFNSENIDRSFELLQLVGNNTNFTLTQNGNTVVYNSTADTFLFNGSQIFFDIFQGSGTPPNITTTATEPFNIVDPITISVEVLPPTPTTEPPPPNLTLKIAPNTNFDIPSVNLGPPAPIVSDFTIEWWTDMTADDNHPRPWSIGSWPDAAHAVSIENGQFYYWIGGNIVKSATVTNYIGNWTHFCIMRVFDTVYIFQNGVVLTTLGWTDAIPTNGLPLYLGSEGNDSLQNGLMSNFRWNNTAVYDEAGFTPPTAPLTNLTGTKLLIFQGSTLSDEIIDQSGNGNIVTNGTGLYNVENPFFDKQGSISFGNILPLCVITSGWSTTNLNVSTYRNGDPIPEVQDPVAWGALTTGAWCYYNNDPSTEAEYGKLYNWYAVNDSRGLAPIGYHIPSYAEYETLVFCLSDDYVAGGQMKETGFTHWNPPNVAATNASTFTGLPGGYRFLDGTFREKGDYGYWWMSDEWNSISGRNLTLYTNFPYSAIGSLSYKKNGLSVRIIRD